MLGAPRHWGPPWVSLSPGCVAWDQLMSGPDGPCSHLGDGAGALCQQWCLRMCGAQGLSAPHRPPEARVQAKYPASFMFLASRMPLGPPPTARCGEPRRMEQWLHLPIRSQGQRRPRLWPRFLPTWRCPVHTWRRPCLASGDVGLGRPEHLLLSLAGAPRSKLSAPSSRPRTSDIHSVWDRRKEN